MGCTDNSDSKMLHTRVPFAAPARCPPLSSACYALNIANVSSKTREQLMGLRSVSAGWRRVCASPLLSQIRARFSTGVQVCPGRRARPGHPHRPGSWCSDLLLPASIVVRTLTDITHDLAPYPKPVFLRVVGRPLVVCKVKRNKTQG